MYRLQRLKDRDRIRQRVCRRRFHSLAKSCRREQLFLTAKAASGHAVNTIIVTGTNGKRDRVRNAVIFEQTLPIRRAEAAEGHCILCWELGSSVRNRRHHLLYRMHPGQSPCRLCHLRCLAKNHRGGRTLR